MAAARIDIRSQTSTDFNASGHDQPAEEWQPLGYLCNPPFTGGSGGSIGTHPILSPRRLSPFFNTLAAYPSFDTVSSRSV
jgi:hypothetical protein